MQRRDFVLAVAFVALPIHAAAQDRPIEILATIALQGALEQLEPALEAAAGPVAFDFSTTAALTERIASGTPADLVILTKESLLDLASRGYVGAPGDLVRSSIGVAVREDAAPPRMSTTEDFVAFLRATPSIAYTLRGVSGVHMAKLIRELGLRDVVMPKAVVVDGFAGTPLREGAVAAAVQQISELRFTGATNIVPLPDALQVETVFGVAITGASAGSARVLEAMRVLRSPAAAAAYEGFGLAPAFR